MRSLEELCGKLAALSEPAAEAFDDRQRLDEFCKLVPELIHHARNLRTVVDAVERPIRYPMLSEGQASILMRDGTKKLREAERMIIRSFFADERAAREYYTPNYFDTSIGAAFRSAAVLAGFLGNEVCQELQRREVQASAVNVHKDPGTRN